MTETQILLQQTKPAESQSQSRQAQPESVASVPIHARRILLFVVPGIFALAAIVVGAYLWNFGFEPNTQQDAWGQFGDYLGGVLNPILGSLSLVVLAFTFLEQREALRAEKQRNRELRDQQLLQSFETTFFQLLSRFDEVISHLSCTRNTPAGMPVRGSLLDPGKETITGREVLRHLLRHLKGTYARDAMPGKRSRKEHYSDIYKKAFKKQQYNLGVYFRTLYHIFKFLDTAPGLTIMQRIRYANIARAQLTSHELGLIFYNGVYGEDATVMWHLICKYGILKHIKKGALLNFSDFSNEEFYPEAATANSSRRMVIWNNVPPEIPYD